MCRFFAIKSDGTGDPANTENISIVVRYIKGVIYAKT